MKTVIRNSYTPKLGDYCETIVVDKESEDAYIFDCDGVFTPVPQPVDVEEILARAAEYTDETVAPINEKLETIEEGAQVNKIEHILKNGTELTITNKTVNVTVPTKTSDLTNDGSDGTDTYVESATLGDYYTKTEADTQIGYETTAREIADQGLQEQIDAIVASSDVVDIVGTYAALQAYDTSKLHDNDIIKVLDDETRDDATTYYRWDTDTSTWSYIGAEGPFYTKAESDATFVPLTRTINSKALSSDITLTAADVGALPDSTVIPTVNDATLTIQENGTTVQTFTANQATNATANITVPTDTADLTNGAGYITSAALPTKTSDLTNDGSDGTSTYVEADDLATVATTGAYSDLTGTPTLATVATSGDYDDLINKPTIPTVNDATLTIQKNGTDVATFTANSSTNQTANITVPTDTSDLTNGAGFITTAALANYYTKSETYSQNEVNSLINSITVPTKTSDLTNDGSDGSSTYVEADDLAAVATSGSYNDLLNKPTIPSYSDFTGATSGTAGAHGLVPAPAAGDQDKVLKGDGTWTAISGSGAVLVYADFTSPAPYRWTFYEDSNLTEVITVQELYDMFSGGSPIIFEVYMGTGEYAYRQIVSFYDNEGTYSFRAVDPTLHMGGSGVFLINSPIEYFSQIDSTTFARYPAGYLINDDSAGVMVGPSGINPGKYGYAPTPLAGDDTKYLKGDGTWDDPVTVDSALDVSSSNPVENSVVTAALNNKADTSDLANYVTLGTDQNITGEKTFVGNKRIKFKGTASNSKCGFTSFDQNNGETGFLEVEGVSTGSKKVRLGCYDNAGGNARDNYVGFQYYNTKPGGGGSTVSYNLVCPPRYRGVSGTSAYAYVPLDFTDGNTTIRADNTGVLDLSTLLPSYSDFTGATSSVAGSNGLVPAPAAGDEEKYLKGDGTWATVQGGSSYTAGTGIDITNDTISVDNTVAMVADLPSTINSTDWSGLWQ